MIMMRILCEWSDEDCVKVDEDKRDLSIIIPLLGQLRSFGKLRFPSESADYYVTTLSYSLFCLCLCALFCLFLLVWFSVFN
ncbi:hypothetical protein BRARA_C00114 [Brassica rapa]|uniref:Uncharacterized protein n=1 Tax=Brassica campestris TaxID=3711 RepID=A0A397ZYJ2_BRACM|nr:hypothetical protein BRARA_C00114 [Brassica rapa]